MSVALAATVMVWVIAFPIGIYSATRQYSLSDNAVTFVGFLGLSIPNFLLALIMMYLANRFLKGVDRRPVFAEVRHRRVELGAS